MLSRTCMSTKSRLKKRLPYIAFTSVAALACLAVIILECLTGVAIAESVTATVTVGSSPVDVGVNSGTNKIYVSNSGANTVSVINGSTDTVSRTVSVGSAPNGVGVNESTNKIYVANSNSSSVSVINGSTDTVTRTVSVGRTPNGVGVNPSTNKIYVVCNRDDRVYVINGATDTVSSSIRIGRRPRGIAVNTANNKIYAVNTNSNSISVINGATDTVTSTVSVGSRPYSAVANPITNMVYVSNYNGSSLSVIDSSTDAVVATVSVGSSPYGVGVNTTTNKVYVANSGSNSVSAVNGATNTVTGTVAVGTRPYGLGANSATNKMYVANNGNNRVSVISDQNPVPAITGLVPSSATAGDVAFTLTVDGTGLLPVSIVSWNGNPLTTYYQSDTQLTADVEASYIVSAGTADITVTNPSPGGGTSTAQTFTINNPVPEITGMAPAEKTVGDSGFTLTLNGTGLNSSSVVSWNGESRATSYVSGHLEAAIPSSDLVSTGTADVTVTNPAPGGGTSTAQTFAINNPSPSISGLEPVEKIAGEDAFALTVNGTGFIEDSVVKWNDSERSTTFVSSTELQASITANDISAGNTIPVVVSNPAPGGGSSDPAYFTIYNPAPVNTGIDPVEKLAGEGGFTLTVSGTGFNTDSVVKWNDSDRPTTVVSSTELQASITAADIASGGLVYVVVDNPAPGGGASGSQIFEITNPAPSITDIDPVEKIAGEGDFTLMVNGTGFNSSSVVRWNGSSRETSFVSDHLEATIPASDIALKGTAEITVYNPLPGGGVSNTSGLNIINPVPVIDSLDPSTIIAGGPELTLTVNGSGFVPGSLVRWNEHNRITTYVSPNQIQATIPATDTVGRGIASVYVYNSSPGGGSSNKMSVNILNPVPVIDHLDPATVFAEGSDVTLNIYGSGFVQGSLVRWNEHNRTTTFVSSSQLQITVPAEDIVRGTASIYVYNKEPVGGPSNTVTLTIYNPVPVIDSLDPGSVVLGSPDFTLTVNGSGFVPDSLVRWKEHNRVTTYISPNQLQITVPAADVVSRGTAPIYVYNKEPVGGRSNIVTFCINNPVPVIDSLSPDSVALGSPDFTLTVNGSGFVPDSLVRWKEHNRVTTYISPNQLQITVPAADIVARGTAPVYVYNKEPGGGPSNTVIFNINNPVPVIDSLNPDSIVLGGFDLTLTIYGSGFVPESQVRWKERNRATTYVSPTVLQAAIPATDVAVRGTAPVYVYNKAPGGGSSNQVIFTINNPVPVIDTLEPGSIEVGSPDFTLTVNGSGFVPDSLVRWKEHNRVTTYISPNQLQITVPVEDAAVTGTAPVYVYNKAPGGGSSNQVIFTILPYL